VSPSLARAVGLLAFAGALLGCSSLTRSVENVSQLKPDEKVIIGDVRFEDGTLSDFVQGIFMWGKLTFGDDLPGAAAETGMIDVASKGGVFAVAVPRDRPIFVTGIWAHSTIFIVNIATTLPFYFKIAPTTNACEYVGTFVVRKEGQRVIATVVDTYDLHKTIYAGHVGGCALASALATKATDEDIAAAIEKIRKANARHYGGRLRANDGKSRSPAAPAPPAPAAPPPAAPAPPAPAAPTPAAVPDDAV
jgi:hypothetical protein